MIWEFTFTDLTLIRLLPAGATPTLETRRTWAIIWPFVAIVIILLLLALFSLDTLTAMRASVTGESAWSKAQKAAVYDLIHYTQSRDELEYLRFLADVDVIHWDQMVRVEMDKERPDQEFVRRAMTRGQIPPEDIDITYRFYRRFQNFAFMQKVVALWKEGDLGIARLEAEGARLHSQIEAERNGAAPVPLDLSEVFRIDRWITPKAQLFSDTLGSEARRLEHALVLAMLAIAAVLTPVGFLLAYRMTRTGVASEIALSVSEERFQLAVSGSNDGIWDWDTRTGSLYLSPRLKAQLRLHRDHLPGLTELLGRLHQDDRFSLRRRIWLQGRSFGVIDVDFRMQVVSDHYQWFRIRGQAIRDGHGRPLRMVGSMSDTTDYRRAADALFAEKERLRVTLAAIRDAVVTTDTEGRVQYLNPAAETLTGWRDEQAHGRPLNEVCAVHDERSGEALLTTVERALVEGASSELPREGMLTPRGGAMVEVNAVTAPIHDERSQMIGMVVALRDISKERAQEADLVQRAAHDSLTGLINRGEFDRRLTHALQSARNEGRPHAVLYLDLDQFKIVNDTCGHAAGDELIRQISVLLKDRLRSTDTLARLGGDEFGVLLENCQPQDAARVADLLRETLVSFRFAWEGKPFSLGVSIGLVNVLDTPMTPAAVLSTADAACYLAKDKGRNRVQVYRPDDAELSVRRGEMEWVSRIRHALEQDQLQLYAQEIVALHGPVMTGLHIEVLVRMIDPNGLVIPPMAFIPAAERFGLMQDIDRWVIRETLATFAARTARDGVDVIAMCAVNVSAPSLSDERFRDYVLEQFVRYDVPFDRICFEVTETTAIANLGAANRFISELQALGCRFALDDFGSGMSSFAYLKQLPVDYLKIDGSFVKDMLVDPMDRSMVEVINQIGHVMGKKTIAEFGENMAIIAELRRLGVDYAQGYGLGEPAPFSERRSGHAAGDTREPLVLN